ncbi:MAG: ECF transporter S component [Clostridia bacterium]|nr:ECF transporter S component [Clostridia bacterium]MBQ4609810.1 ECF transporter S component [Clostridia bacterium]MBQ7052360.1 ECF transporter S component [Clostridia bacterium]
MTQTKRNTNTMFNLTRCGLLSAMAVILFYIEIPVVAFYKLDLSTLPAILAGFAMGPWQGFAVIIIKNLVHMLGTSTAGVGELADILMSCAFVIPASLIYRRQKSRKGALKAMLLGSAAMVIVSVLVNYFILIPAYQVLMNLPLEAIIGMGQAVFGFIDNTVKLVIFITAPFNILKAVVLSVVTYLLYKRVSPLLHQKSGR